MAKQPPPLRPGEPPERSLGADLPAINEAPLGPEVSTKPTVRGADEQPMRVPVQPSASRCSAVRRMDRYDVIGAVIVALLVALWVVHFLLPTPPPDNVP
jgi:hypothetical protein